MSPKRNRRRIQCQDRRQTLRNYENTRDRISVTRSCAADCETVRYKVLPVVLWTRQPDALPLVVERSVVEQFRIDDAEGTLPLRQIEEAPAGGAADVPEKLVCPGNRVRREEYVVQFTETVRRDDRFILEAIECCTGDASAGECVGWRVRRKGRLRQRFPLVPGSTGMHSVSSVSTGLRQSGPVSAR